MMSIARLAHLTGEQIQSDRLRLAHAGLVHGLFTLTVSVCLRARCSLTERALPTIPHPHPLPSRFPVTHPHYQRGAVWRTGPAAHRTLFPGECGHQATCTQPGDGEGAPGARRWHRGPCLPLNELDRCGSPFGFCCRRPASSAPRLKVRCPAQ